MKILIIYSGGTIGQVWDSKQQCSRPPESDEDFGRALSRITENFPSESFSYHFYTTKESSNMQPEDWQALADMIYAQQTKYDGIIIAHGTDTLSHTACALALAFYNPDIKTSELLIPVVMTGAQIELFQANSDGDDNLANAIATVRTSAEMGIADVLVVFGRLILLGTRTTKISEEELDAFASPSFPAVGRVLASGARIEYPPLARIPDTRERMFIKQIYNSKNASHAPSSRFAINVMSNGLSETPQGISVLTISYQPGINPEIFKRLIDLPQTACIVIRSLGAGNVCTEGRSLLPIIEYAVSEYRLPVMIASSFPGGNTLTKDETGTTAVKAGVVPVGNHTESALSVKSLWLIANGFANNLEEFSACMQTSFVNEADFPKPIDKNCKMNAIKDAPVPAKNPQSDFSTRLGARIVESTTSTT